MDRASLLRAAPALLLALAMLPGPARAQDAPLVRLDAGAAGAMDLGPGDLAYVRPVTDAAGQVALEVGLAPARAAELGRLTAAAVGSEMALSVCGEVLLRPQVLDPILGGVVWLSGLDAPAAKSAQARLAAGSCGG